MGIPLSKSRYTTLLALVALIGTGVLLTAPHPKAQAPTASTNPIPADIQDLINSFEDVGELKFITPLKLAPDQLDKLAQGMTAAQATYNSKVAKALSPYRGLADTIRQAKRQALLGKAITGEDQVIKTVNDVLPKRQAVEEDTLKAISSMVQEILTKEQYATAVKITREEQSKLTKQNTSKGSDAQWFNLYVLRVIMSYPRIVPLLKEVKAASEAGSQ